MPLDAKKLTKLKKKQQIAQAFLEMCHYDFQLGIDFGNLKLLKKQFSKLEKAYGKLLKSATDNQEETEQLLEERRKDRRLMDEIRAALTKQPEKNPAIVVQVNPEEASHQLGKGEVKEAVFEAPSMSRAEEACQLAVQLSLHLSVPLAELLIANCTRLSWTQVIVDHLEKSGLSTLQIVLLKYSFMGEAGLGSKATVQAEVAEDTESYTDFAEERVKEREERVEEAEILHQAAAFFASFAAKYGPSPTKCLFRQHLTKLMAEENRKIVPSWEHFEILKGILCKHTEQVQLMGRSMGQSPGSQDLAAFDKHLEKLKCLKHVPRNWVQILDSILQ